MDAEVGFFRDRIFAIPKPQLELSRPVTPYIVLPQPQPRIQVSLPVMETQYNCPPQVSHASTSIYDQRTWGFEYEVVEQKPPLDMRR